MGFFTKLLVGSDKSGIAARMAAEARQLQEIEADMIACGWTDWERKTILNTLRQMNRQMFGQPESSLLYGTRQATIAGQYRVEKERQRRMRLALSGKLHDARLTNEEMSALMRG